MEPAVGIDVVLVAALLYHCVSTDAYMVLGGGIKLRGWTAGNREVCLKNMGFLFTDDLTIEAESTEGLQATLDCLSDWCGKWQLDFNVAKINVMIIPAKGQDIISLPLTTSTLQGQSLLQVHQYTYLGTVISDDLTWGAEIHQ